MMVSLRDYPLIKQPFPFNVTIIDIEFTCAYAESSTYMLGDPKILLEPEYMLPEFFDSKIANQLSPVNEPLILDVNKKEAEPSAISYQKSTGLFEVQGYDTSTIGTWFVGLRLGYREYPESQIDCVRPVTILFEEQFIDYGMNDLEYPVGDGSFSVKHPDYENVFGENFGSVKYDFIDQAKEFLTIDPRTNKIMLKIPPDELGPYVGVHQIRMIVTDKNGA